MARVSETKFAQETLFRIQKPFSYAGKVFRGRSIEQRDNGKVMVTGTCCAAQGHSHWSAEYGVELEVHENTPVQALVDAGINLDALNVYLAARKERQAEHDAISARVDRERAADKLVRDAAHDLLAACKALLEQGTHREVETGIGMMVEQTEAFAKACAAIAKATGSAS